MFTRDDAPRQFSSGSQIMQRRFRRKTQSVW